jgi:hypothetical protein
MHDGGDPHGRSGVRSAGIKRTEKMPNEYIIRILNRKIQFNNQLRMGWIAVVR